MKKLQTIWRNLNLRERIVAFLVLLVGIGAAFYQFEYEVQQARLKSIQARIDTLEPELNSYRQALSMTNPEEVRFQIKRTRGEIIRLQEEIEFFKSRMSGEARDIIRVLRRQAQRQGMEVVTIDVDEQMVSRGQAVYRQIQVHLEMVSDYSALPEFIRALDGVPALLAIRRLQVNRVPLLMPRVQTLMTVRLFVL